MMQYSELHLKASSSGMIKGMVNPFESIIRCMRFHVKLPLGEAYNLLFFAKLPPHRMTMLSKVYLA